MLSYQSLESSFKENWNSLKRIGSYTVSLYNIDDQYKLGQMFVSFLYSPTTKCMSLCHVYQSRLKLKAVSGYPIVDDWWIDNPSVCKLILHGLYRWPPVLLIQSPLHGGHLPKELKDVSALMSLVVVLINFVIVVLLMVVFRMVSIGIGEGSYCIGDVSYCIYIVNVNFGDCR